MSLSTTVYESKFTEQNSLSYILSVFLSWIRQKPTDWLVLPKKPGFWSFGLWQRFGIMVYKISSFPLPPFVISKDVTKIKCMWWNKKWIEWVVWISHVLNHYDHHLQILTDFVYFMSEKESKGGKSRMVISYTCIKYEKFIFNQTKRQC